MPSPLFNIPHPDDKATEPTKLTTGVLNSSQGAATFLGAPAAVTLMWKVLKVVSASDAKDAFINSPGCGALLATLVGICIWFASSAPVANDTSQAKVSRSLSAIFSIFAIIAATLGINPKDEKLTDKKAAPSSEVKKDSDPAKQPAAPNTPK